MKSGGEKVKTRLPFVDRSPTNSQSHFCVVRAPHHSYSLALSVVPLSRAPSCLVHAVPILFFFACLTDKAVKEGLLLVYAL